MLGYHVSLHIQVDTSNTLVEFGFLHIHITHTRKPWRHTLLYTHAMVTVCILTMLAACVLLRSTHVVAGLGLVSRRSQSRCELVLRPVALLNSMKRRPFRKKQQQPPTTLAVCMIDSSVGALVHLVGSLGQLGEQRQQRR